MTILSRAFIFFLLPLLAAVGLHADAAKIGQRFPVLTAMQDQHENAYPWPAGLRHVIVAYSMQTAALALPFSGGERTRTFRASPSQSETSSQEAPGTTFTFSSEIK